MRSRWTLVVTDLGPIKRTEIEIRPLMLFVGHNNSGKSYLASLLWDFYARMPEVFSFHGTEFKALLASPRYQACSRWLADKLSRLEEHTLTGEDVELLLSWFNERLDEKKDAAAQRIFGRASMTVGRLEVHDLTLDAPFSLVFRPRQLRQGSAGEVGFTARGYAPGQPRTLEIDFVPDVDASSSSHPEILIVLLAQLLSPERAVGYLGREYVAGDPVYLPASRTGFMLLYKGVVAGLLDRLGSSGPPQGTVRLTTPSLHFLQLLAVGLKAQEKGKFAAEADFLERQSFPGTVALAGSVGVNDVEYRYAEEQPPLPMQLASSLVTELAPIILVLRHVAELPLLIIEEPEAHLHPHLQRVLAQTIARLVRKGLFVWITTHSENFCQQINNFIKLGSLPEPRRAVLQERLGYEAQDYLAMDDVAGYQLRVEPGGARSSVARLDLSESGLAMPTFNEELFKLSDETLALQREVEGEE